MSNSREVYETWSVQAAQRAPLVEFMETALTDAGCTIIQHASPSLAPFRLSFATPWGERHGIVAYAFLANSRVTRNRPADEHRFQLKYGSKDGELHELWQDPYGLYTTLLVGINPDRGLFVGADPVLNSPTRLYISKEFKEAHVGEITRKGWHAWERQQQRKQRVEESQTTEVLVGGKAEAFLKYVLFEREARGEDQGHRHLLADQFGSATLDPLAGSKAIYRALPLLTRER